MNFGSESRPVLILLGGSFGPVEDGTSRGEVVHIFLRVESNVISRCWGVQAWSWGEAESFYYVIYMRGKLLNSLGLVLWKFFGSDPRDEVALQVPLHIFVEVSDHVQVNDLMENLFGSSICAVIFHGLDGSLEEETFSESLCQGDDLVTNHTHPYIIEFMFLLQNEFLHQFHKWLDLHLLLIEDEGLHTGKVSNVLHLRNLPNCIFLNLGHFVLALPCVRQYILHHFLHKHAVVTFCGHARVGRSYSQAHLIVSKESGASSSFPRDSCCLLLVPRNHCLDNAKCFNDFMFSSFWVGEYPLTCVQTEVQHHCTGQKRQQGVLLQLIRHNRCVRLACGSHCKTLLRIFNGVVHNFLRATHSHSCNTKTSTQQSIGNFEEPFTRFLLFRMKFTFFVNVIQFVEHLLSRNDNIVKEETSIIDAIKTEFHSHVLDGDAFRGLHFRISNLHEESIESLVFAFDQGLGEHDCPVGVTCTVCNPILLWKGGGRMNCEGLRLFIVERRSFHFWGIVAVSKLSETKASHIFKRVNILHHGQVAISMKSHQWATKKIELDSEFSWEWSVDHRKFFVASK